MSDKNAKDALAVSLYKTAAALRRAERKQQSHPSPDTTATSGSGLVVLRLERGAKPLSALGGVQKVLGPSHIHIAEYKLHRG